LDACQKRQTGAKRTSAIVIQRGLSDAFAVHCLPLDGWLLGYSELSGPLSQRPSTVSLPDSQLPTPSILEFAQSASWFHLFQPSIMREAMFLEPLSPIAPLTA